MVWEFEWGRENAGAARAMGMSEAQIAASRPALSEDNQRVLDVWRFCEGWNLERLPLAVAWFAVTDVDALIEQLQTLRNAVEQQQALRRAAEDSSRGSHGR